MHADWFKIVFLFSNIRLWTLDFYHVIADKGAAQVNNHA